MVDNRSNKEYMNKVASLVILATLILLSYFLIKKILMSIIAAIILAFIFTPLQKKLSKKIKSKNLSALIVTIILILLIVVPVWFLTPALLKESIHLFSASQKIDLVTPLQKLLPGLFTNPTFSNQLLSSLYSFITGITNGALKAISKIILNFPHLLLEYLVILFTFFFVLRDGDLVVEYIQSLLPFPKETEKKLFKSSRDITISILFGQVVVGIIQGIIAGISFYIFGVHNSLILTLIAIAAGIFPVISTTIVWVPVAIYVLITRGFWPALGITAFGIIGIFFENVIKPHFVSKRTNIHMGIILLGMIGGIIAFGILGIIIGPLILAYLLIVLELYRKKGKVSPFIQGGLEKKHK